MGFPATEEHALLLSLGKRGKEDPSAWSRTPAAGGTHIMISGSTGSHRNTVTQAYVKHTLSQTHRLTQLELELSNRKVPTFRS